MDNSTVYISPKAYLRSMWAILWSCFRHPFSTTVIDLADGTIVEGNDLDETDGSATSQAVTTQSNGAPAANAPAPVGWLGRLGAMLLSWVSRKPDSASPSDPTTPA
jgi:hypothetical protein